MFSRPCSSLALLPAFPRFLSKSCTFGAAFSVPVLLGPAPLSLFFAMLHRVMSHDDTRACSLSSPPLNALLQVCPAALAVGWSYACCSQTLAIRLFVSGHESKARQTARHESQNCLFVCANKNGARSIVKMGRFLDWPECSKHASLPMHVWARCLERVMIGRGVDAQAIAIKRVHCHAFDTSGIIRTHIFKDEHQIAGTPDLK